MPLTLNTSNVLKFMQTLPAGNVRLSMTSNMNDPKRLVEDVEGDRARSEGTLAVIMEGSAARIQSVAKSSQEVSAQLSGSPSSSTGEISRFFTNSGNSTDPSVSSAAQETQTAKTSADERLEFVRQKAVALNVDPHFSLIGNITNEYT